LASNEQQADLDPSDSDSCSSSSDTDVRSSSGGTVRHKQEKAWIDTVDDKSIIIISSDDDDEPIPKQVRKHDNRPIARHVSKDDSVVVLYSDDEQDAGTLQAEESHSSNQVSGNHTLFALP
jgi:hypothetical protein